MDTAHSNAAASVRDVLKSAGAGLVEREALVELIALAAVAREHLLVIGPPGTAKSEAVRRVARATGARTFEYLLGRFTEPSEIFGPVDLRRLKEGVVATETSGMLPEAEFAFLDEVFHGSTAILNTLLGLLNERIFRRGSTFVECPLRVCVGASNALPDDESLAAFADRFLLRVFVEPIPDPRLEDLLEEGWRMGRKASTPTTLDSLDELAAAARDVDLAPVRSRLAQAIRLLRGAGITLSDRRAVRAQNLIAAAAVMGGRTTASEADLWPLLYVVPTAEGQQLARDVLRELLAPTQNPTLPAASAEASLGPLARALRIAASGRELLQARPEAKDAVAGWHLKLEGVAREIDATFPADALPADLQDVRARLVEAVRGSIALSSWAARWPRA